MLYPKYHSSSFSLYLSLVMLFSVFLSQHANASINSEENIQNTPAANHLIGVNVGVDLSGLAQSTDKISTSIDGLSDTLQQAIDNPNLNEQQKQNIQLSLNQLNQLGDTFQQSLQQLPTVVERSTPPLIKATSDFLASVQQTILLILLIIVLVLITALWAVYYFIIKPSHNMLVVTTTKLDNMANAMANSAYLLESTQQQQDALLQRIETLQQTSTQH